MRKLLLVGALMVLPVSALSIAAASPAFASKTGVKCTSIKGKLTGKNATISGCNDTKNTGGSGKAPIASLESGSGTVTWNGTGTTTLANGTFTQVSPNACPTGSTEYEAMLTVTGGTGAAAKSILTGWTVQAFVCVSATGKITIAPGTDVNIGASY